MNVNNYITKCLIALILISCEGPEGKVGPSGKNSVVKITEELPGINCTNGGQKIETGIDENGNGQLSTEEVEETKYVCNGKNSLINVVSEPLGANCPNGGLKIEVGVDLNGNNSLEINEISQTKFLCNGINGLNNLTIYTNEPAGNKCPNSGFKIDSGLDINSNLVLDPNEITLTKYLCLPGSDKQVRLEVGESNVGTNSPDWFNTPFQTFRLIKFNKLNYSNVDSITFVPSMYTPIASNKVYVQLYNWTDNVEIANSELTSNTTDYIFIESKNIFDQLPNKEITLGIRLKSESSNYYVSTGIRSYIFVYKH
jgi:hypothetical protein